MNIEDSNRTRRQGRGERGAGEKGKRRGESTEVKQRETSLLFPGSEYVVEARRWRDKVRKPDSPPANTKVPLTSL